MNDLHIKICGITRLEDARLASELGAWALGFVFFRGSRRAVEPRAACRLIEALPARIRKVGVFVDEDLGALTKIAVESGIDSVQLHGSESVEYCAELRNHLPSLSIIKAIRVRDARDLDQIRSYENCDALLLDTYVEGVAGGTGRTFNWSLSDELKGFKTPIIVSGGLKPENVSEAVAKFQPFGVDVSSGVELEPGVKSQKALRDFFSSLVI